jgi:hypothetical protein
MWCVDQLPVGGVPAPGGPPGPPDMWVQWCPLDVLPDPLEPVEPVELLLDDGALYVDELAVLPVWAVDPVEAACATAAPPNAPAEARTASTVILRRIWVPPLRFMDDCSQRRSAKGAVWPC